MSEHVVHVNDNQESFFELSQKKRVTIRKFKGKPMIDIREFYEADGDMRPGKKGITLTLEQYRIMREIMEDIDNEIDKVKDS